MEDTGTVLMSHSHINKGSERFCQNASTKHREDNHEEKIVQAIHRFNTVLTWELLDLLEADVISRFESPIARELGEFPLYLTVWRNDYEVANSENFIDLYVVANIHDIC